MGGAAGSMYGTKVNKGKKMPGRMGGKRVTMRNLLVYNIGPSKRPVIGFWRREEAYGTAHSAQCLRAHQRRSERALAGSTGGGGATE